MPIFQLGKALMLCGALLLLTGAALWLGARFGLGQLPGDLAWKRGNTSIYVPVVTSLLLSIIGTIVLNLLLRFFR